MCVLYIVYPGTFMCTYGLYICALVAT